MIEQVSNYSLSQATTQADRSVFLFVCLFVFLPHMGDIKIEGVVDRLCIGAVGLNTAGKTKDASSILLTRILLN